VFPNYHSPRGTSVERIKAALDQEVANCESDACRSTDHFKRAEVIDALARALDAAVKAEAWLDQKGRP
jgi:hypothetical protein